jgi:predicted  nucleic acid-binding Zn-ribbon protein
MMVETVAVEMMEQLLSEYVKRTTEKALAGKKLSDWEIGILMMDQLRSSLETRISSMEKRIEKIESDVDYLKKSLDSLRDNVINVLVAELKRRTEKE